MVFQMAQARRFLGAKFGYGETIPDGIYAVPIETTKGEAFMKAEVINNEYAGKGNFKLFWDEVLSVSWHDAPKPPELVESEFAKAFRNLESCR
jgi:hypothetical protein